MGIDSVAGRAEFADGLVLFDVARPVLRTGKVLARITALVVDASHIGRTAAVTKADGDARLTVVHADADGLVIQHLARLARRGGARIAGASTWADTPTRQAGRVTGAVVIHTAFDRVGAARHLAQLIDDKAVLANADGPVATDFTSLALVALDVLELARIGARSERQVASVICRALRVPRANGCADGRPLRHRSRSCDGSYRPLSRRTGTLGVGRALDCRPADVALWAGTACLVHDDLAKGVHSAGFTERARVLALFGDAGLVRRAVVVVRAGSI